MANKIFTYEQPLNELIRVCLRLEHLFQQLKHHLEDESPSGSRIALATLLDITNVTDRPDLRSKFSRVLSHYANALAPLEQAAKVDNYRLREVLVKLDRLIDMLYSSQGRFAQNLRENEFLNSIRLHLAKPGGICDFNFPAYHLWLQQPANDRKQTISSWFKEFEQLYTIVALILQLTRDSTEPLPKVATKGFYQESLAPNISYQMIRVSLPINLSICSEISVGPRRLSIHFYAPNFTGGRAIQINEDVEFQLSCCVA
ncbi:MAG: cell division protein ZapD [Gammaproteobacteria bacterium]